MKYKIGYISSFSDQQLIETYNELDLSQQEYISRKNKKGAKESLCARSLLIEIVNEQYKTDCKKNIRQGSDGHIFIEGMPDCYVSISHSKDMTAVCCSENRVGIDIEKIREISDKLKQRICKKETANEEDFFRIWTLKEAYLKASQIGFAKMLEISEDEIISKSRIVSAKKDDNYFSVVEI